MLNTRESWTDERLDDFAGHVDRHFDAVDKRFDRVEAELQRVDDRLDGLQRTMAHGFVAMTAAIIGSNAALIALFATRL